MFSASGVREGRFLAQVTPARQGFLGSLLQGPDFVTSRRLPRLGKLTKVFDGISDPNTARC